MAIASAEINNLIFSHTRALVAFIFKLITHPLDDSKNRNKNKTEFFHQSPC